MAASSSSDSTKPSTQLSWSVALVAFLINAALTIGGIAYYFGKQEEADQGREKRIAVLEADKAQRLLREQQELYDYQKERAEEIKKIRDLARDLNKANAPTP